MKEKTKYCRGNMEFFEWLRKQGCEILWNDKAFSGSFEEFIEQIRKDTATVTNVLLNKSESIEALKARLNENAKKYDKVAVIGHSTFQDNSSEAYFRIPVSNGDSILVKHDFFSSPFELITCFMNDSFSRTWKINPGNGGILLIIKENSQFGCSHLKNGKIFYNEFDIYAVILNPTVPPIDYSPIDISID